MPEQAKFVWRKKLTGQALAGVSATADVVIVADRDPDDTLDIFRCLDATTGAERWSVRGVARGELDYGNSPRATPLVHGDFVYLFNAFGRLQCVRLANGEVVWKKDLLSTFGGQDTDNHWGTASSPLIVNDKLIVNPGGAQASIVALNPATGEVLWKTPGDKAAFSSFVVATLGGVRQLVGYDKHAILGLDIATGKQLWRLKPPRPHDFNVPTPLVIGERLIVSTENNGTREYRFTADGKIVPEPVAVNEDLAPDTHTPIIHGRRLYGVWSGLFCLDLTDGLKTIWRADDKAYDEYAAIIGAGDRALVISRNGELLLIDTAADQYRLVSRLSVFRDDPGVLSHPALVGKRLYLRGSEEIVCLELE